MTYGQFGGAEPALRQDVLRAAARHLPRGVVFSNGTIRLDPALPYAIHISVWGLGEQGAKLRGADVFTKALRNYRDDPRATFIFTLNSGNLESAPEFVRICADAGVRVSFSHFSPTLEYGRRLVETQAARNDYFRFSSTSDNLMLDGDGLTRAQELITAALDAHPETVVYSHAFNRWIHRPEGVYEVDPDTGMPSNCGSRVTAHYRHFHTDMSDAGDAKCCTPNIDCRNCRLYAQSLSSALHRMREFTGSADDFSDWLDIWEHWRRLFLVERPAERRTESLDPAPQFVREPDAALVPA
ncbi:hypothetical protein GCM10008171_11210 [Methylopila jiangsuensis]|uniref:Radical SAM protein n=1 Tax=Methylopila jiangsuensis TaxID=586230 RepID=A0A9W6N3A6_9HYPH|nr:hypothetical protein [Methylopila jiangsuensis]MDR6286107.1 hypothetical protein [Methylopila jiangsuensis]GLK75867.1 hypothetical protein GCM10008171_11210 [Methylopila jiangsuensis]